MLYQESYKSMTSLKFSKLDHGKGIVTKEKKCTAGKEDNFRPGCLLVY